MTMESLNIAIWSVIGVIVVLVLIAGLADWIIQWAQHRYGKAVVYGSLKMTPEYSSCFSYEENEKRLECLYRKVDSGYVRVEEVN